MDNKEKLLNLIRKTLKLSDETVIPEENFFSTLQIDSLLALELLVSIEMEFGIQIDDQDLNVDLLTSIQGLLNYIEKKQ